MYSHHKKPIYRRTPRIFKIDEETTLLSFLIEKAMKDESRTTIKQVLRDRFISVDEKPTTQFDYPLPVGSIVRIHESPLPEALHHPMVNIVWQDDYLVLVEKHSGVPTVSSGIEKDETVLRLVSNHLKTYNPKAKVFHLNRIDKDSSGLVLMAKSADLQKTMTENWSDFVKEQTFIMVVEGTEIPDKGELIPPKREQIQKKESVSRKRKLVTTNDKDILVAGKACYQVIKKGEICSMLTAHLDSGRNNQLRKQFAALHCPIAGDWRNGSTLKGLGRVLLQTLSFTFIHPINKKEYTFKIPIEPIFSKLVRIKKGDLPRYQQVVKSSRKNK